MAAANAKPAQPAGNLNLNAAYEDAGESDGSSSSNTSNNNGAGDLAEAVQFPPDPRLAGSIVQHLLVEIQKINLTLREQEPISGLAAAAGLSLTPVDGSPAGSGSLSAGGGGGSGSGSRSSAPKVSLADKVWLAVASAIGLETAASNATPPLVGAGGDAAPAAGRPFYGDAFASFASVYSPIHYTFGIAICTLGIFANLTNIVVLTR